MPQLIPLEHRNTLDENGKLGFSLSPVTKFLSSMTLGILVIIVGQELGKGLV